MWLPHRNAVIRHNCLHSPIGENKRRANRTIPPLGPHNEYCQCLKCPCYVDCPKPPYSQLRYITIESIDNHETSQETKSDTTKGNQEKVAGRTEDSSGERWGRDGKDKDPETDTVATDGDLQTSSDMAWMWDRFSVDDYCPKPEHKTVTPKAAKPRATVVKPFQMTLREEQRRQKPQQAWEKVTVEPEKPPKFKANPVPASSRSRVYDRMVLKGERQRKILHEERKKYLQAIQCPFSRQGGKTVASEKSTKRMAHSEEEEPTFRPAINHSVPNFTLLHHSFEEKLKTVRQKRQTTIPQPFSFEASVSGQKITIVKEPPKSMKSHGEPQASPHTKPMTARSAKPTKAAMLREEAVRKRLASEAARREVDEKHKSDKRTMLQKEIGMWVAAHNWYSSANEKRSQYYRREMRARSAEYHAQLAEMMDRVNRRPLMLNSLYHVSLVP
ncbi:hypothetical protein ACEWY4_009533 [Coilia grayii]|uniref:TPX2 C-terminal domain-containing protein n=1 Tax=Coilia grayii TaxID=363190 RepID=A0ABD1K6P0_9TELE